MGTTSNIAEDTAEPPGAAILLDQANGWLISQVAFTFRSASSSARPTTSVAPDATKVQQVSSKADQQMHVVKSVQSRVSPSETTRRTSGTDLRRAVDAYESG